MSYAEHEWTPRRDPDWGDWLAALGIAALLAGLLLALGDVLKWVAR